ncbi:hypothetical protein B0H63DRAFT_525630 [Podospora didyma]|uniref:Uncharacterized protein n=1 Tax=Podospora didyma TaxID=330526 RepID=A0AAE0KKN6_9PEZI|nr:hypothetical protein B0H63DRAFT_525630 [Podospora didyma]
MHYTVISPSRTPSGQFNEPVTRAAVGEYFIAYSVRAVDGHFPDLNLFEYLSFSLYWCTKSFNTSITAGTIEEDEVARAVSPLSSASSSSSSLSSAETVNANWFPQLANDDLHQKPVYDRSPSLTNKSLTMEHAHLRETYTIDACTGLKASNSLNSGFMGSEEDSAGNSKLQKLDALVANVADSLTEYVLSISHTIIGGNNDSAIGTAYTLQPVVKVRWEWLTMLACRIVLSAVVLAAVTKRATTTQAASGDRKDMQTNNFLKNSSSSVATMCALNANARAALGSLSDLETVMKAGERRAREAAVFDRASSGCYYYCGY